MTAVETPAKVKPEALYAEYWTAVDDHAAALHAVRCIRCGTYFLPRIMTCTGCGNRRFDKAPLSAVGSIYSYTIVHGAGGLWPPVYAVGYVDFPEGVRVFGHIRECDPSVLSIGAPVGIEHAVLYMRKDGTPVKCFRFHLLQGSVR